MPHPRCISHLRDYVAIPSVNPMRRTDIDPQIVGELRYAEHMHEQLRALGLDAQIIGQPDRPSVIAEASVSGARETLLVASHLDTVPVDGMEISPFDPQLRGGRLYGRGSCDTKAGMAALMDALETVLTLGTLRRNVVIVGESDEELGSIGVNDVIESLGSRKPDWVIATEPTSLRVVTRHKGIAHAQLKASGIACHSSAPEKGRNAIVALSRAVLALEDLQAEIAKKRDERLGPGTLSVGLIGGGSAANVVPEEAWLVLDRRLLPGEDENFVRQQLRDLFERTGIDDVEIDWCRTEKAALGTEDTHASVLACQAALADAGLPTEPDTAAFGTDAGVFTSHGIGGVVFGPGSIEQAHTASEWVETAQVETASAVFRRLLESPGA
ncbi:MAG: M20 family metallopeptidase [bacterium]|nr:M20 family metallopeptidase [bacterium]